MSSDILLSESLDTPVNALDLESRMNLSKLGVERDAARGNPGSNTIGSVYGRNIQCDTASGASYVEKYLHPPSERRSEYRGIPDRNSTPSVDLEWRMQDELEHPATAGGVRALYISPPSVFRTRFVLEIDNAGNISQVASHNTPNPNLTLQSWNSGAEAWRMAYCSDTYFQDVTALNNAGMLYGCTFRPNVSLYASNSAQKSGCRDVLTLNEFHGRYNRHAGYADFRKKVVELQVGAAKKDDSLADSTPALSIMILNLGKVPTTGGEVLMKSPNSESWRSTEGAFFVHHHSEPETRYISQTRGYTDAGPGKTSTSTGSVFICAYEYYTAATDLWTIEWFQSADQGSQCWDASHWAEMTWSMMMYDFGANVALGNTSRIVHKKIVGVEVQPVFGSILMALTRQCPYLDQRALDMCTITATGMKDMLPARANALGSFIMKAASYAPTLLKFLSSKFGSEKSAGNVALRELAGQVEKVVIPAIGGAMNAAKKSRKRTAAKQKSVQPAPQMAKQVKKAVKSASKKERTAESKLAQMNRMMAELNIG